MSKLAISVWMVVILSEAAIAQANNPYACLGEADGVVSLKLTDRSLEKLKSEGISGDTLRALEAMKGNREIICGLASCGDILMNVPDQLACLTQND